MARKKKYPEHEAEAERLMNELLDLIVLVWTTEEEPELKTVAAETELSPAKIRKLLITAGERDRKTYYRSDPAAVVLALYRRGMTIKEIQEATGLSYQSVHGYLPYSKTIYSLASLSAEAERIRLYRKRKKAVKELQEHLCESVWLWRAVIAFENYPFLTAGRGSQPGVAFTYTVSREGKAAGRHYKGETEEGYGNELWIIKDGEKSKKSISRSTVDLAFRNAMAEQEREGFVAGPRKLGVPGVRSNLYALFLRFGVITDQKCEEVERPGTCK